MKIKENKIIKTRDDYLKMITFIQKELGIKLVAVRKIHSYKDAQASLKFIFNESETLKKHYESKIKKMSQEIKNEKEKISFLKKQIEKLEFEKNSNQGFLNKIKNIFSLVINKIR